TSCSQRRCPPSACWTWREPTGPSRTSSTGSSTSSSTRIACEAERTTPRRTSPCCESSLSTSCDSTPTRAPSKARSSAPDGTTPSSSHSSVICDSPALRGRILRPALNNVLADDRRGHDHRSGEGERGEGRQERGSEHGPNPLLLGLRGEKRADPR